MNQHEAPVGTIGTLGNLANDTRIVKMGVGWRYLETDKPVNGEDLRVLRSIRI